MLIHHPKETIVFSKGFQSSTIPGDYSFRWSAWHPGYLWRFVYFVSIPRKFKDQTLPLSSRESFIWIILKTILCLVDWTSKVCINRAQRNPNDLYFYFLKANPRKTRPCSKGHLGSRYMVSISSQSNAGGRISPSNPSNSGVRSPQEVQTASFPTP